MIFLGCVETGFFCARYLLRAGLAPAAVVSLDPDQAAAANVSGYRDLFDLPGLPPGCERYRPRRYDLRDPADLEFFAARRFDLLVILGWQRLIPTAVIETLSICGLTVHGSSGGLPKGRGRSPMNWALIEGARTFHLSLLTLSADADAGQILDTQVFDILPRDDIRTLYYKNALASARMMEMNVPRLLAGERYGITQDERLATHYPKRTPEDGRIDWRTSARSVEDLTRAVTKPYPGAFTFLRGERISVWNAQVFDTRLTGKEPIGTVVAVFPDGAFLVKASDVYVLVDRYQGVPPCEGDLLE